MSEVASAEVRLRYHTHLIEVMADAVIGTDAEYRVTLWNPAAEQLYGYRSEDALGRYARELATYEGDTSRRRLEDQLDRTGRAHVELAARRADGTFVEIELKVTVVRGADDRVVGYLGIHRDISERKRVELEHRRLSAIVQNSSDFIGLSDLQGRALFLNEAGQRLVGLEGMDEVVGRSILEFVAPEQRERVRDDLMPEILEQGQQAGEIDLINVRTQERIPVSLDGFRIDDPEAGRPALATISRDLRDLRRSEAALEASEHDLQAILASITDGFCAVDAQLRLLYINAPAAELIGDARGEPVAVEDLLGREVTSVLPVAVAGAVADRLHRVLDERRPLTYDYNSTTGSGARWFEVHVHPSGGGLAVHVRETTDRKVAELARDRQARQQAAVAELGIRASRGEDVVALMEEAVAVVARTLGVELVAVDELLRDGSRLLLRAGLGWEPGRIGRAENGAGARSLMGFAIQSGEALICDDVAAEGRCAASQLLIDHDVASAAVVLITGRRRTFGTLGVFARRPRRFSDDEVHVLQAIANVLASAIERAQMAQRVGQVREAERQRIARALHDDTLQELGVAIAQAARAADGGADGLLTALQRVGWQVRAAIHDLRVGERHDQPFGDALGELVDLHRAAEPEVVISLAATDLPRFLPGAMATHVLGFVGEGLVNARRHAAASRIDVRVAVDGPALVASVADDGRGGAAARRPDPRGGHGIPGLRERGELLGGVVSVTDRSGGGTLLELRAPLFEMRRPGERVRVLLVDDHAATREAMSLAFAEDDGFAVVAQAASLAEARSMLDGVDVAIIDLGLPDGDGAELIAELRAANADAQALVLSAHIDRAATARAVEKGASAVLGKVTHLHEIVSAVRRLQAGETLIPLDEVVELLRLASRNRERALADRGLAERLTPREREVLQLMADGLDGHRIAASLHITPRTQRNHVANILTKLCVHSQLQAVLFGVRHGLVSVPRERSPDG